MDTIIAEAKAQLDAVNATRDKLLRIISIAESIDPSTISGSSAGPAQPRRQRDKTKSQESLAVVRRVLDERGTPVAIAELVDAVLDHGIVIGGKDDAKTLSARLSNSTEFESHRGLGWWHANVPLSPERDDSEEAEGHSLVGEPSASHHQGGPDGTALAR